MLRALRVLAIAAVIAVSLAFGGSTASADTITVRVAPPAPLPTLYLSAGLTWE